MEGVVRKESEEGVVRKEERCCENCYGSGANLSILPLNAYVCTYVHALACMYVCMYVHAYIAMT